MSTRRRRGWLGWAWRLGALAVVASAIHLLSVALLLWLPAMDPAAPENGS